MGLLTEGTPLRWDASMPHIDYVKKHGILQFLNIYHKYASRCCDEFKWGDELEYLLVSAPPDSRSAHLSLRALEIQQTVHRLMQQPSPLLTADADKITVHPEYGSFMIEATPKHPYGDTIESLLNVERNMYCRKLGIQQALKPHEYLLPMSAFPMLGVDDGYNVDRVNGSVARSQFISDELINPHPRFATLTRNIRLRRGQNVDIYVPIYRDLFTPKHENAIFMDAMAFGMGCCCLQVTHQCRQINEARRLYDQLAVLTPILMSLTASTPFLKGKISDFDCRWSVISQSVDDRTHVEKQLIHKSRYDTISNYLSLSRKLTDYEQKYNDIDIEYDESVYQQLREEGIDDLLSKHVAHLFIRDPLVIYSDLIENVDDETSSHHFETIQSTNWQNVRFKPPPSLVQEDVGWRVEFRSMELQFTEFENAAFSIFVTLLAKAILYYDMNLYIPISKVDANFHRAHRRDSARKEKFWWRSCCGSGSDKDSELNLVQLSMKEIMCGNETCMGLIEIVRKYLREVVALNADTEEYAIIDGYLRLIEQRSKSKLLTPAQWLREFVDKHPDYKHDSTLNQSICRDIVDAVRDINSGDMKAEGLLPDEIDIQQRYYRHTNGALRKPDELEFAKSKIARLPYDYYGDSRVYAEGERRNVFMKQRKSERRNECVNAAMMTAAAIPAGACLMYLRRLFRVI